MYQFNFFLIFSYWPVFLKGLGMTLLLSIFTFILGFIISLIIVFLKKSNNKLLQKTAHAYVILFKAIPALVMIIWAYYALPLISGISLSPFFAALLALSINISPFLSESIISGINAIPKYEYESAIILGFSKTQSFFHIVFPQVFKNIAPDLLAWFITLIKFTSLVSIIGFNELLHISNLIISNTFLPFEVYTMVTLIYIILIVIIEFIFNKFTKIKHKSVI